MFNIKRIDISNFGNGVVPRFQLTDLNIQKIHNGVHSNPVKREESKKVMKTSTDIFNAISRRYNKFRYAYYNKGVQNLDKDKINKCYQKTKRFLITLQHMHRKLIANRDPRADHFGKKLAVATEMVQRYGAYVMRLNQGKCTRAKSKIQRDRNKIRK